MANHKSSKKRIRRNAKRALVNRVHKSAMRTYIRKVKEAIQSGDAQAAQDALRDAQPKIHRSVSKGVIHKKTAARQLSRLSAHVKALKASA